MAQHKAPTAITIAPTTEKSAFALFVDRYWKLGALLAVAFTAAVLWKASRQQQQHETRVGGWNELLAVARPDGTGGQPGSPADIRSVAERVKATDAGAWGYFIAAKGALDKNDYDLASASLADLKATYPQHALLTENLPMGKDGALTTAFALLELRIRDQRKWAAAHPGLFGNPEPPADAPRVRLNTDKGAITILLYPELAPKHVENFLKLCREGYYNGTKFHALRRGSWIRAGDPNSKETDTATWGEGGPGYGIDAEANDLRHFSGYLSMWKKPGETQSSGSQFVITTGAMHALDGQQVVFGKVVEGVDTTNKIESSTVTAGTERPEDPSTIQSVDVL